MKNIAIICFILTPFQLFSQTTGKLYDKRDGKTYQTVKIGNHWWMAENLNYGTKINGNTNQTSNGFVEKYCYSNLGSNCNTGGALYQWNEMMNYTTFPVNQGICPAGWHVPTDDEWKELEIYLGMSVADANLTGFRGTDQGTQLKSGGSSGFNATLDGYMTSPDNYVRYGTGNSFWTATDLYARYLLDTRPEVYRWSTLSKSYGLSLRCKKNTVLLSEQPVSYVPESKTSLQYRWADFDNDNDIDLLVTSNELDEYSWDLTYQMFTTVYKNNGSGAFTETIQMPDSVSMGSSSVGDYDNDGDIDIIVSGAMGIDVPGPEITAGAPYTRIFQNNITSFDVIETEIMNLCRSAVEFQDFDNDGDLDVVICGDKKFNSFVYNPFTAIYRNDGDDDFEEIDTDFINVAGGRISCFDYDENGLSDILITGLDQNNEVFSAIYKNTGGFEFEEIIVPLDSIRVNYNGWFDLNRDGQFDLISGGSVFKNNGEDVFTRIDTLVRCAGFGDFNNDGYNDIINDNKIYMNDNGAYFFAEKYSLNDELYSCADINNDDNIDIIGKSHHYINYESRKNTRPSVPGNLRGYLSEGKAVLKWNRSVDSQTSQNNITYNVSIGVNYNKHKFFSSGSDLSTGYRRIMKSGNAGTNDSIVIEGIKGTLHWQVQAVDNNMLASQFSQVDTFVFPAVFNSALFEDYFLNYRWGDYNMDGKVDYLSEHSVLSQNHHLNENTGNMNFSEEAIFNLPKNSDAQWKDYDNDNDIDLIGIDSNFIVLNNGANDFTKVENPFPVQQWGRLSCIQDLDNDGDNDFIISTATDTRICFRDSGDAFSLLILENAACDSITCFDYDNDSDNDIFIRDTKARYVNIGYRRFEKQSVSVVPYGLTRDFDNDGDVDVLHNNILYVNDNQNFILENTAIRKLSGDYKQTAGDFDNDGDFDIVLTGVLVNAAYLGLFLNDGKGKFTEEDDFSGTKANAVSNSTFISGFVDFDNDNDLDFVYTYSDIDFGEQRSNFERNNFNKINTAPGTPDNLESLRIYHGIELSWIPPDDKESGTNLTYNLRIGKTPGGMEIMSPVSDVVTGKLFLPETGHVLQPYWRSDSLPSGTYYWSVQTVDHGYQGGQWPEEQIFTISNIRADFEADTVCSGFPTSFTEQSNIFSGLTGSWLWDFGDGTLSTERNPVHQFNTGGIHHVMLKVTAGQDVDSISKSVYVRHKPHPGFTVNMVCEGNKTTFTNLSDIDSITVDDWEWSFGDGDVSDFQGDIEHPYLTPGRYNAQLKVSATNGCSDSLTKEVVVGSIPNAKIGLDYGFPELCKGDSTRLSVEFNSNYHYQWKTGGVNLTNDTLDYLVIKNKGDFSVEITNRYGNCLATSEAVNINMLESPPSLTITANADTNICQGEKISLEVPYDPLYSYSWKHNGLILSDATSNSYDAEKEGSYTVDVSFGTCKTTSKSKQIVYKPGLPQPKLLAFGTTAWYFVCDIENVETYRWYYNGNLVAETSNNIYWAGGNMGEYYVEVNDEGECFIPSEKITIPVISTNIRQIKSEHRLFLYPNPTSGTIRILYADQYIGEILISISNIEGRVLKTLKLYKNHVDFSEEIYLHGLMAGLYILEFQTNQYTLKERFLIMK